ncbi:MAG: YhbY family RNA-binding protein [Candidatus Helarchaeota archaeon]
MKIDKNKLKNVWEKPPHIIVGKNGWQSIIEEFKRQIKKHKIIKVKLSKNARTSPIKEIAEKIAINTNSELIEIRGFNIIYFKR